VYRIETDNFPKSEFSSELLRYFIDFDKNGEGEEKERQVGRDLVKCCFFNQSG
jgi:hypothetical protein